MEPFFRRLFHLSLEGLNIGTGGGDPTQNGEAFAIAYCLNGKTAPIVFDVGGQGGLYSMEALKVSGGSAKVYTFEPSTKDHQTLTELLGNTVTVVKSALGDKKGEAMLYSPKDTQGLSSLYQQDDRFTSTEKVAIDTIDEFCFQNKIDYITLLKLDVEGYELSCLRGAKSMLPHIDYIQFEMSITSRDAGTYFRDIFNFLSDYTIYRILRDGLSEIKYPEKITELLFTTNYLAIRHETIKK